MTIPRLHEFPKPWQPARHGQPWTDDDYDTLITMCRSGATIDEVSEALERKPASVLTRAKRLLPMAERGIPIGRVLTLLSRHLIADAEYDWESHLAAMPPPRPEIKHVHPPAQLTGIDGLSNTHLVIIAAALAQADPDTRTGSLASQCGAQIHRRNLEGRLIDELARQAHDLLGRTGYGRSSWNLGW